MELTFFFQGCVCTVDVICNWWHDDLYKGTNRKRKCFCFSCLPHKQAEASTLYPNQTHPWPQNTEFNSALSGRWWVKKEMLLRKNRNILHTLESILSIIPFVASPCLIHKKGVHSRRHRTIFCKGFLLPLKVILCRTLNPSWISRGVL